MLVNSLASVNRSFFIAWAGVTLMLPLGGCYARPAVPAAPAPASAIAQNSQVATEYDLVYAMAHGHVSEAESPFLATMLKQIEAPPAGATALDIGSGSGRNTLYLARHGYHVTGVDLSRVGLDLTQQAAARDGLAVTTLFEDINRFDFGHDRWNLILLIDFPFPYKALLPKIAAGLKPGGVVVAQDVSTADPSSPASADGALRYTFMNPRDLDEAFAGFTVLHYEEAERHTIWGVRAVMIRYAARKPR